MKKLFFMVATAGMLFAACSENTEEPTTTGGGEIDGGKDVIVTYSFHSRSAVMSSEVTVQMDLYVNGNSHTVEKDVVIPVEVDVEKSTAVEGTHFAFVGAKEVVVPQGKSSGSVTLKLLSQEEGHDVVVLKPTAEFEADESFVRGDYNTVTITIFGSFFDKLEGTWKTKESKTDAATFSDDWWWGMIDATGMPEFNAEDTFIFNGEGLSTSLKSGLKNFFKDNSEISAGGLVTLHTDYTAATIEAQMVLLHNANRYFSATQQSEDTEAYIAFYFNQDNEDECWLFLIDYEPKDFLQELYEYGNFGEEKPNSTDTGAFLWYVLERVK